MQDQMQHNLTGEAGKSNGHAQAIGHAMTTTAVS